MKKLLLYSSYLLIPLFALTGCNRIGSKTASISIVYGIAAILSFLLLLGYCLLQEKKNVWFLLLFTSVLVVNIGYFTLSISKTLEEGLLSNRISYFGSVFLPMAMLMIILNVTKIHYNKWFPGILLLAGIIVFFITASPGYSTIYYQDVSLEIINGVTTLHKVYGPWHSIYLFYLFAYFTAMITAIILTFVRGEITTLAHAIILVIAVFVNIGVWLIEQLVKIDFEILSISYIISEAFLLGLNILMQEEKKNQLANFIPTNSLESIPQSNEFAPSSNDTVIKTDIPSEPIFEQYLLGISKLTKTEHTIFNMYVSRKTTKEIMAELNITENTLKFHNKNIYSKLSVSSRKQLLEIYHQIPTDLLP